jgi:hypothetical protein
MARCRPKLDDKTTTTADSTKVSTGAGIEKRRSKKLRFYEDSLLNVERKAGKYLKISVTKPNEVFRVLLT